MSFGGPGLGLFACRSEHVRQMPGRVVGRTNDAEGAPGFVLTFSTREQHIRREKATSNICSNHALNALAAAVYLSAVGREGLAGIGRACIAKAHYFEAALVGTGRFSRVTDAPFAHEFTLRWEGDVPAMQAAMLERGFLAGLDLGRFAAADEGLVLFAVTEKRTRAEMDRFVEEVSAL
jgi:glycine dehydrogenase subunit 1